MTDRPAPQETFEPCAFGPDGEHHGGELVRCAVCDRPTCDYCGSNDAEGDWLCPDHAPQETPERFAREIVRRAVCPDCDAEHGQPCRHDKTCQECGHPCDHMAGGGCIFPGCRCRIPVYRAERKHRPRVDLRYELVEVGGEPLSAFRQERPPERWRVGRKVGRTIYRQAGPKPSDADVLIGVMDTPDLARAAIEAHNLSASPSEQPPETCRYCGEAVEVVGYDEHHRTDIVRCGCTVPLPAPEAELERALDSIERDRREADKVLIHLGAARTALASIREHRGPGLTRQQAGIAMKAIEDVWRVEPDDHPEPNAATLTWRALRAFTNAGENE